MPRTHEGSAGIWEGAGVARLGRTVPALPVREIAAAVDYYERWFGFSCPHRDSGFAVLIRDDARLHLWQASDTGWKQRADAATDPVRSGAESFLAGTASCRIETDDVDALYAELAAARVLHPVDPGAVTTTDFGTREFATVDLDGNLLEFYRWQDDPENHGTNRPGVVEVTSADARHLPEGGDA